MKRMSCDCRTCEINSAKIGVPFPMAVDVPEALASKLSHPHGIVHAAHEPNFVGKQVCQRTGVVPVTA